MTKVGLVLPEVFRTEVCAGLDPMLVAKVLADRGTLLRAERHYQRTHRIQGTEALSALRFFICAAEFSGTSVPPK